jgi:hypothetical protein
MNKIGMVMTLAVIPLLAGTGCATYGPTWSEISGERYNVSIMNRRPTSIQTIDGYSNYVTYPVKLEPGAHVVRLAAPVLRWPGGSDVNAMNVALEPCMRYYLNAQFDNPLAPTWRPVIDFVEPIAGCRTVMAAN